MDMAVVGIGMDCRNERNCLMRKSEVDPERATAGAMS